MIVEIKGASFENLGSQLMVSAALQQLAHLLPEAKVAMSARSTTPYEARCRLGALQKVDLRARWLDLNGWSRFLPRALRQHVKRWGLVFECDVDVMFDLSGFGYSDQWGGDYAIRHAVAEAIRFKSRGGHYIFLPQAFGPFGRASTGRVIAKGISNASLVCARDPSSLEALRGAAGEFSSLRLVHDFTNGLVVDEIHTGLPDDPYIVVIPNANMQGGHSSHHEWHKTYIDVLDQTMRIAHERGLRVYLINFGGPMDQRLIDGALDRNDFATFINATDDLHAKAIIAQAKWVVSSRFHACVCALSSGVPCLGTSWSHKYEHLFADYHASGLLMAPDISIAELQVIVDEVLAEGGELSEIIKERAMTLKEGTKALWAEIARTLGLVLE